jgi:hypothetical protein
MRGNASTMSATCDHFKVHPAKSACGALLAFCGPDGLRTAPGTPCYLLAGREDSNEWPMLCMLAAPSCHHTLNSADRNMTWNPWFDVGIQCQDCLPLFFSRWDITGAVQQHELHL